MKIETLTPRRNEAPRWRQSWLTPTAATILGIGLLKVVQNPIAKFFSSWLYPSDPSEATAVLPEPVDHY
jgi:hypothetical protein